MFDISINLRDEDITEFKKDLSDFNPNTPTTTNDTILKYLKFYGLKSDIHFSLGKILVGTYEIATYYYQPERAIGTVLVFHGYLDHSSLLSTLIHFLLELNYSVLMVDHPGHGLSSGVRASIPDFNHYREVADKTIKLHELHNLPGKLHLIGHSMGGAVILDVLRSYGKVWDGATILLAPLVRSHLWRFSKIGFNLVNPFVNSTFRRFQKTSHDRHFLDFLRKEPLRSEIFPLEWAKALYCWNPQVERADFSDIPITIIQGTGDDTVHWRHNVKFFSEKFPSVQFHLIPGARHHLVNEVDCFRLEVLHIIHDVIHQET